VVGQYLFRELYVVLDDEAPFIALLQVYQLFLAVDNEVASGGSGHALTFKDHLSLGRNHLVGSYEDGAAIECFYLCRF
jgi:hypothetical protein